MKNNIGNNGVLFVRIYGRLISIAEVDFVQTDPNTGQIVQELPLTEPINRLMWNNLNNFIETNSR